MLVPLLTLKPAALLPSGCGCQRHVYPALRASPAVLPLLRAPPVRCGLFDNIFGATRPDEDEAGKFSRHLDLEPGGFPLGVLVAGLGDDALEAAAAAIEAVWSGAEGEPLKHVPIVALAEGDLGRGVTLRSLLAALGERDSVLPDKAARVTVPLVLLSGFSTVQTSLAVRRLRALGLVGGASGREPPMFAVAVPNSLDKSLRMLCEEIEGDHRARQARAKPQ